MASSQSRQGWLTSALIVAVSLFPAVWAGADNIAVNGGFEDVDAMSNLPQGWRVSQFNNHGKAAIDASLKKEGVKSLTLEASRNGMQSVVQELPPLAGHSYELSAWIRIDASTGSEAPKAGISIWSKTLQKSIVDLPAAGSASGEFKFLSVKFSVPADSKENVLSCRIEEGAGKAWFDNVKLIPLDLPLASKWTVFLDVAQAPASFDSIPASLMGRNGSPVAPQSVPLSGSSIDLAALGGSFHDRDIAVLYNEFTAERDGLFRIGIAADWWMEAYANGKLAFSSMKEGNGVNSFKPDDHVFVFPVKAGKNILAVKVLSGSEGWRFVCGLPSNGAGRTLPNIKFKENAEWKPVDLSDVQVKPGSALDLSAASSVQLDASGRLPRLTIGPSGKLVAEGRLDVPVRLKGYTLPGYPILGLTKEALSKGEVDEWVRQSRIQGYNLFRFYDADIMSRKESLSILPELLDRADYLLYQMGKQGVYMHFTLAAYNLYLKPSQENWDGRDKFKLRLFLGDPAVRKAWRYGAETMLNHVNPYTGLAWKDDPAIACVEFYNEQEWGFFHMNDRFPPELLAEFDAQFRLWLAAKYKEPAALAKAWGDASLKSFEDAKGLPRDTSAAKERDFMLFCDSLSRECFDWYAGIVRGLGYKGLVSQYTLAFTAGGSEVRYEKSQVAIDNTYIHPGGAPMPRCPWGSKCQQGSSVGEGGGYWRNAAASRFEGRPLFITEFNHAFWNQWQHECGLLFGAYSAFQGFDALVVHDRRAILKVTAATDSFNVDNNPVARANEFLAACLHLRGDVKPAIHRVELEIPEDFSGSAKAVSIEQAKTGFMTGFSIAFPQAKTAPGTVRPSKPDVSIGAASGSSVKMGEWAAEVLAAKDARFSIDSFAKLLKEHGVLPKGNISNPSEGVFQSDTGELTMRTKEKLLKLAARRSEAVSLDAGRSEAIGSLSISNSSVPALVAACSVDGEELSASKRIALIYSTDAANTDMELSGDRVDMVDLGRLPVLMRAGKLDMTLKNSNGSKMALYALGVDGSRKERLPIQCQDGLIKISLDTAALKNGPTPFFELVAE